MSRCGDATMASALLSTRRGMADLIARIGECRAKELVAPRSRDIYLSFSRLFGDN